MPNVPEHIDGKLLSIYLQDHLAGATAGRQRLRRMARADASRSDELTQVARELDEDRDELASLIARLGLRPGRLRQLVAAAGELLGLAKLNGRLLRKSPLTPLLESELARSAVIGKIGLWQTLTGLAPDLGLSEDTYRALTAKAENQIAMLDRVHAAAIRPAFATSGGEAR